METIIIVALLLSVLYLIFAHRDAQTDISDLEYRIDILKNTCKEYEHRINKIETTLAREGFSQRRTNTDSYSRVFKTTISKLFVYCNNGWSISKTLFTKAKSKTNGIFKGSIRPAYIRAKQNVQRIVYRAKERQEVLSIQRAEDIH